MARWTNGEQTVQFLVNRNRLESFEAEDLAALAEALLARAMLRVETTATGALAGLKLPCRPSSEGKSSRSQSRRSSSSAGPATRRNTLILPRRR